MHLTATPKRLPTLTPVGRPASLHDQTPTSRLLIWGIRIIGPGYDPFAWLKECERQMQPETGSLLLCHLTILVRLIGADMAKRDARLRLNQPCCGAITESEAILHDLLAIEALPIESDVKGLLKDVLWNSLGAPSRSNSINAVLAEIANLLDGGALPVIGSKALARVAA